MCQKKKLTPEHRHKLSLAHIGKKHTPEELAKMSASMIGKNTTPKGPMSDAHKLAISKALLEKASRGKDHYRWVDDKSDYDRVRRSGRYRQWRKSVLDRDGYTCVECGARDVPLQVHHILPFIDNILMGFDINNGVALCVPCHINTDNYGFKTYNYRKATAN